MGNKKREGKKISKAPERIGTLVLAAEGGGVDLEAVYRETVSLLHGVSRATIEGVITRQLCDSVTRTELVKLQYCIELDKKEGCYILDEDK